jgi:hypothetical protein
VLVDDQGGGKRRDVIATVCPGCSSPLPPRASRPAPGLAGRYRIEISSEGIVAVVDSDDRLDVARSLYRHAVMK